MPLRGWSTMMCVVYTVIVFQLAGLTDHIAFQTQSYIPLLAALFFGGVCVSVCVCTKNPDNY